MKKRTVAAILMTSAIALSACGEGGSSTSYSGNNASSTIEASSELDSSSEGEKNQKGKGSKSGKKSEDSSTSSEGTLAYTLSDGEEIEGGTYTAENATGVFAYDGGTITVDDISSLEMNLEQSDYTGAINSSGQAGTVVVNLSDDSTWTLTADSYI